MAIAYQSDQGVATITIDRPEKKNAITGDMYDALVASLKRAADDKSVRAVLVVQPTRFRLMFVRSAVRPWPSAG